MINTFMCDSCFTEAIEEDGKACACGKYVVENGQLRIWEGNDEKGEYVLDEAYYCPFSGKLDFYEEGGFCNCCKENAVSPDDVIKMRDNDNRKKANAKS